jgi:hypothetical protein
VLIGTLRYKPFDKELFGRLVPDCRIIVSASAGYNEFDVDWMTSEKIWFCNTRNAVSEATADMTLFLTLAVLKDTSRAERQAREGKWRHGAPGLVPTTDPRGLVLGIIGMGSIGKVIVLPPLSLSLFPLLISSSYHCYLSFPRVFHGMYAGCGKEIGNDEIFQQQQQHPPPPPPPLHHHHHSY